MTELSTDQVTILRALAGQSEGYLAQPNAACFIALGLDDAEGVEADLQKLTRKRPALADLLQADVTLQVVVGHDPETGEPMVEENTSTEVGWAITPEGREAIGY